MNGYTKLFSSIVTSTVWDQDPDVCKVWITLMALSDQYGEVQSSVPGLANAARLPREAVEKALAIFLAPDPDSRTTDHQGRRIEKCDGGWVLLNHAKYRERQSQYERRAKAAEKKRRQRRQVVDVPLPVPVCPPMSPNVPIVPPSDQMHIRSEADQISPPYADGGNVAELPRRAFGGVSESDLKYRAAYEAGMVRVLPNFALSWNSMSQGALNASVAAHGKSSRDGKSLRGDTLLGWIRDAASDFGDALKLKPDEAKFYSDGDPKGFLRWLNRDALATEARRIDGVRGR